MFALFKAIRQVCIIFMLVLCLWQPAAPAWSMGGILPPLNEPAPVFTLPTNDGQGQISLSDYLGKWVVLYFYPKDFTPGCTVEAQRFQRDSARYQLQDSVDEHAKFCTAEGLKFPLLADEEGAVSKMYGSWMGFLSMRHTFLIDPKGILRERFVKVSPAVHSTEVLERLAELQKAV
jgi:thioredoxin-dependent peroxiredoxin